MAIIIIKMIAKRYYRSYPKVSLLLEEKLKFTLTISLTPFITTVRLELTI